MTATQEKPREKLTRCFYQPTERLPAQPIDTVEEQILKALPAAARSRQDKELADQWGRSYIAHTRQGFDIDRETQRLMPLLGKLPEGSCLADTISKQLEVNVLRHGQAQKHDLIEDSFQLLYVKAIQAYQQDPKLSQLNLSAPALLLLDAAHNIDGQKELDSRVKKAIDPHFPENQPITYSFPYRMDRMIRTGVQMLEAGELAINALHDELSQQTDQYTKPTLSA